MNRNNTIEDDRTIKKTIQTLYTKLMTAIISKAQDEIAKTYMALRKQSIEYFKINNMSISTVLSSVAEKARNELFLILQENGNSAVSLDTYINLLVYVCHGGDIQTIQSTKDLESIDVIKKLRNALFGEHPISDDQREGFFDNFKKHQTIRQDINSVLQRLQQDTKTKINYTTIKDIILPPDQIGGREPGQGESVSTEPPYVMIDKFGLIMNIVKELRINSNDYTITIGAINEKSMRKDTYILMIFKSLNKTILLNNAYGEATFLVDHALTQADATSHTKIQLQNRYPTTIKLPFVIGQQDDWKTLISNFLQTQSTATASPQEYTQKNSTGRLGNAINSITSIFATTKKEKKQSPKTIMQTIITDAGIKISLEHMAIDNRQIVITDLVKKWLIGGTQESRYDKWYKIGRNITGSKNQTREVLAGGKQFHTSKEILIVLWAYMIAEFGGKTLGKTKKEIEEMIHQEHIKQEYEESIQKKSTIIEGLTKQSIQSMTIYHWELFITSLVRDWLIGGTQHGRILTRGPIANTMAGNGTEVKKIFGKANINITKENLTILWAYMIEEFGGKILGKTKKEIKEMIDQEHIKQEHEILLTIRKNYIENLSNGKSVKEMNFKDYETLITNLVSKRMIGSDDILRKAEWQKVGTTITGSKDKANKLFAKGGIFNGTRNQLPILWAYMIEEFSGETLGKTKNQIEQMIHQEYTTQQDMQQHKKRDNEMQNIISQVKIEKGIKEMRVDDWNKVIHHLVLNWIIQSDKKDRLKYRFNISVTIGGSVEKAKKLFAGGKSFNATVDQLTSLWSYMIAEFGGDTLGKKQHEIQNMIEEEYKKQKNNK